jgi:hypothetical protein
MPVLVYAMKHFLAPLLPAITAFAKLGFPLRASEAPRWSAERAGAWSARQPCLAGCNYVPGTAINQLEMWQADTFDLAQARDRGRAEVTSSETFVPTFSPTALHHEIL